MLAWHGFILIRKTRRNKEKVKKKNTSDQWFILTKEK